jgi:TrpR-related protein YerC/YecD
MSMQWKNELTDQLCEALLTLGTIEEVYDFLEDVATIAEIRAFSQRLQVAKLLMQGDSYPQISKSTGASTATISRVRKTVDYGKDGFKTVLDRMRGEDA